MVNSNSKGSSTTPYTGELSYVNFYKYPPTNVVNDIELAKVNDDIISCADFEWTSNIFTIYIGIPFCRSKCNSCPFFKELLPVKSKDDSIANYVDYLLRHIENVSSSDILSKKYCRAIFFGGGTASLLSPLQIKNIIESIFESFNIEDNIEITLEGNPLEYTKEYLHQVYSFGINRLSIGLQSFQDKILNDVLNSPHRSTESYLSLQEAVQVGFRAVNIDLLYGLPQQTLKDWKFEVETALKYKPQSITTYHYVIHQGSRTERLLIDNKLKSNELNSNEISELENWTLRRLVKLGYIETKSGTYHLPGKQQEYGKFTYREGADLVSFGAGSYSFFNGYLVESPKYVSSYKRLVETGLPFPAYSISRKPDKKVLMERFIIMNLMTNSVDTVKFYNKFKSAIFSEFNEIFSRLLNNHLITVENNIITLTDAGKFWRRHIMIEFYSFPI